MTIKPLKFKSTELVFLIVYAVFLWTAIVDASLLSLGILRTVINYGSIFILAVLFIIRKYTLKQFGFYVLFGIFAIAAITTKRTFLLVYMMLLINGFVSDFRKIVKVSFVTTIFSIIFVILCCKLGIIADYIYERDGIPIAHSYGFGHYSSISYFAMYLTLMWLYLRQKAIGWIELLIIAAFNYGIYAITTTRLSFFISMAIVVLYAMLVKLDLINISSRFIVTLATIGFPVAFLICVGINFVYNPNNPLLEKLNEVLNNRLLMGSTALDIYGLKLFGQEIKMVGITSTTFGETNESYFYIDSGYMYSLIGYGILFTVLLLSLYIVISRRIAKNNEKVLLIWVLSVMAFNISNNSWISITYNPLLFYIVAPEMKDTLTKFIKMLESKLHIKLKI